MSRDDRTVHAVLADGSVLARYDRAGKWYREYPNPPHWQRRRLSIASAVQLASDPASKWFERLPGGMYFDAQVRRARAERAS